MLPFHPKQHQQKKKSKLTFSVLTQGAKKYLAPGAKRFDKMALSTDKAFYSIK